MPFPIFSRSRMLLSIILLVLFVVGSQVTMSPALHAEPELQTPHNISLLLLISDNGSMRQSGQNLYLDMAADLVEYITRLHRDFMQQAFSPVPNIQIAVMLSSAHSNHILNFAQVGGSSRYIDLNHYYSATTVPGTPQQRRAALASDLSSWTQTIRQSTCLPPNQSGTCVGNNYLQAISHFTNAMPGGMTQPLHIIHLTDGLACGSSTNVPCGSGNIGANIPSIKQNVQAYYNHLSQQGWLDSTYIIPLPRLLTGFPRLNDRVWQEVFWEERFNQIFRAIEDERLQKQELGAIEQLHPLPTVLNSIPPSLPRNVQHQQVPNFIYPTLFGAFIDIFEQRLLLHVQPTVQPYRVGGQGLSGGQTIAVPTFISSLTTFNGFAHLNGSGNLYSLQYSQSTCPNRTNTSGNGTNFVNGTGSGIVIQIKTLSNPCKGLIAFQRPGVGNLNLYRNDYLFVIKEPAQLDIDVPPGNLFVSSQTTGSVSTNYDYLDNGYDMAIRYRWCNDTGCLPSSSPIPLTGDMTSFKIRTPIIAGGYTLEFDFVDLAQDSVNGGLLLEASPTYIHPPERRIASIDLELVCPNGSAPMSVRPGDIVEPRLLVKADPAVSVADAIDFYDSSLTVTPTFTPQSTPSVQPNGAQSTPIELPRGTPQSQSATRFEVSFPWRVTNHDEYTFNLTAMNGSELLAINGPANCLFITDHLDNFTPIQPQVLMNAGSVTSQRITVIGADGQWIQELRSNRLGHVEILWQTDTMPTPISIQPLGNLSEAAYDLNLEDLQEQQSTGTSWIGRHEATYEFVLVIYSTQPGGDDLRIPLYPLQMDQTNTYIIRINSNPNQTPMPNTDGN